MSSFADYVDETGVTRLRAKGGGGGSQPGILAFTATFEDVLAADGVDAATATPTGGGSHFTVTAVAAGISGNAIAIVSDVQPSVGALTIEVSGLTVTLHLETDGDSIVVSTFSEVRTALASDPAVTALVTVSAVTLGSDPYDIGDTYLGGGTSELALAALSENDLIWDATLFIPEAWDAETELSFGGMFSWASALDPSSADEASGDTARSMQPLFDSEYRLRLTASAPLVMQVGCEAGAVPSEGEILLVVDVRTPA